MTDLEITKACAEAMGIRTIQRAVGPHSGQSPALQLCDTGPGPIEWYDPLHDDAQAMALVKKFNLVITQEIPSWVDGHLPKSTVKLNPWDVCANGGNGFTRNDDLNRAICECVAKMQQAKCAEPPESIIT